MEKHFVTFLSPGSFVAEETTKEIESWDVDKAVKMSMQITERYNAKPYGFYFTTRSRRDEDFDSKQTDKSGIYYLAGKVLTLEDIKDRNDSRDDILVRNMEANGWDKVVETCSPWRWNQPLEENDVVLNF